MKPSARARSRNRVAPPARATRDRKTSQRKAPTNLSLRVDLIDRARALQLNVSKVVEGALETAIIQAEQARWLAENEGAIDDYNEFIKKHGLFGDEFREF